MGTFNSSMDLTIEQALFQGINAHNSGNYQEAKKLYKAILQAEPNHPDANHNLGILYAASGKAAKSIPFLTTALNSFPQEPQFWISLTEALIVAKEYQKATTILAQAKLAGIQDNRLSELKTLIPIDTPSESPKSKLGLSYKERREIELAQKRKKRLQKSAPNQDNSNQPEQDEINAVLNLFKTEQWPQAEHHLQELSRKFPNHPFAWQGLAEIFSLTGRKEMALEPLRQLIQITPKNALFHMNLGALLLELGRFVESEECYRKAIGIEPNLEGAHINLGNILQTLGRLEESEACYREAIRITPDFAEIHSNLGNLLKNLGRFEESEASYREAIRIKPSFADAYYNLGNTLKTLNRFQDAEANYRKAIQIKPDYAEAIMNLAVILFELGRIEESEVCYREAILIKPDFIEALSNLGALLNNIGRFEDSEITCRKSINLNPNYAEAHNNLGNTLRSLGRLDESKLCYQQAIGINPNYAEAYSNLGNTFHDLGRLEDSELCYREAIRINPDYAEAHSNLGLLQLDLGKFGEAEASLKEGVRIAPDNPQSYSKFLFLISFLENTSPDIYLNHLYQFRKLISERKKTTFSDWLLEQKPSKLRIGFVSGDLRNHPVGYFIEALCKHINTDRIELVAFSNIHKEDELTSRIRPYFSDWYSIVGMSDDKAAQTIHEAGIHILTDLSGHTAHNRLGVFAYKPSPVQVSWLGYWASTGVAEIDYLIGDPFVTPIGEDHHYSELVWRLPETRFCFTPPSTDVSINTLPYLRNGFLTFGCFNNLLKMTDHVVDVWAKILHKVPNSKLFLKANQLLEQSIAFEVLRRFSLHGIEEDRLLLEGPSPRKDYLERYNQVDIALDPFPYTGGTTTVEALWMGVPVLTKQGNTILSRQGVGIAHNTNQVEWIALSDEEYVAKAVSFASDIKKISELRNSLRSKVLRSPLFDAPKFAGFFEKTVWEMWERYLKNSNV